MISCRYFVLHKLPGLTFLDSRAVSGGERKEAKRVGAFMRVVRPPDDTVSSSIHHVRLYKQCEMLKCSLHIQDVY